nr:uncharacterized protein LOC109750227 [Aegilops tauschii subsp. strangulata]
MRRKEVRRGADGSASDPARQLELGGWTCRRRGRGAGEQRACGAAQRSRPQRGSSAAEGKAGGRVRPGTGGGELGVAAIKAKATAWSCWSGGSAGAGAGGAQGWVHERKLRSFLLLVEASSMGRPWVVCTGRRGEGSDDGGRPWMLLQVFWRRQRAGERGNQREREQRKRRRSSERGGAVTGVGDEWDEGEERSGAAAACR